jgi:hypothetical protein
MGKLKDTICTDTDRSTSYLDLHLQIDSEERLENGTTKEMISIFPSGAPEG